MRNEQQFKIELEKLLNKLSIDNECETPDYILAELITKFVKNFSDAMQTRDNWFEHSTLKAVKKLLVLK